MNRNSNAMAYTKLHQSLVTSTIWREPNSTRIVWVTMMALADKNGEVQASIPGLADISRVTIEECESALLAFLSPDPYSRTKTLEGRRIQEIQGGWFLVNHDIYRAMASKEDATQKASERMARHRRNKAQQNVTKSNKPSPLRSVTTNRDIAEAEAEAEKKEESPAFAAEVDPSNAGIRIKKKRITAPDVDPGFFDLPFHSMEFETAWNQWLQFKKERKQKMPQTTIDFQLKRLFEMGEEKAIRSIENSITQNWTGLFEAKAPVGAQSSPQSKFQSEYQRTGIRPLHD